MDKKLFVTLLLAGSLIAGVAWFAVSGLSLAPPPAPAVTRPMALFDQVIVVITAFVVKPLYMLLSLLVAWSLRKARSADLVAVRAGSLAFFLGEAFCAINYLFFGDQAYPAEFLHSFGMLAAFGFIGYGLLHGLDTRIIRYSDEHRPCALIGLCGACAKTQPVTCRGRRLFRLTLVSAAAVSLIPLMSSPPEVNYGTSILGTPYTYTWLRLDQLFELRFSPTLALVMFGCTLAILGTSKGWRVPPVAIISLCAGIGALGFGLMRMMLGTVFLNNLAWAAAWEEITELILIVAIAVCIFDFRGRLLLGDSLASTG